MNAKLLTAMLVALATVGCVALAATSGKIAITDNNVHATVSFSDHDRRVIEEYYRPSKQKHTPPGLAKKGGVPPGLAKQGGVPPGLARRDRLPADVRGDTLPAELERQLSPIPSGYARLRVGGDFVIVERNTRVVFDIALGLGE